jgi:hypothetical protein
MASSPTVRSPETLTFSPRQAAYQYPRASALLSVCFLSSSSPGRRGIARWSTANLQMSPTKFGTHGEPRAPSPSYSSPHPSAHLPDVFLDSYMQQICTGDRTRGPSLLRPPLHASLGSDRRRHPHHRVPLAALHAVINSIASGDHRKLAVVNLQCALPEKPRRRPNRIGELLSASITAVGSRSKALEHFT